MHRVLTPRLIQSILLMSIARDSVVTPQGTSFQADQVPPIWGAASDLVRALGISLVPGPRSAGK